MIRRLSIATAIFGTLLAAGACTSPTAPAHATSVADAHRSVIVKPVVTPPKAMCGVQSGSGPC
jgi:hypothetical protein